MKEKKMCLLTMSAQSTFMLGNQMLAQNVTLADALQA
jgi:hypothetical protein